MSWRKIYQQWSTYENLDESLSQQLAALSDQTDALEDAFYAPLEFGTAGMRGILGPGINRMNIYTIRQATEGLARFIDTQDEDTRKRGVAIAYDSRHLSPEFALEAACTLAQHGIPSYVFESLRPTPELSFAVRHLNTFTGIMITASHNPANYNGYKVYGEDGGQMPPADAAALTTFVREIENPLDIAVLSEEAAKAQGLIHFIGEPVDQAYLAEIKSVTINQPLIDEMGDELKLIYKEQFHLKQVLSKVKIGTNLYVGRFLQGTYLQEMFQRHNFHFLKQHFVYFHYQTKHPKYPKFFLNHQDLIHFQGTISL